jgi:hypothetical protein
MNNYKKYSNMSFNLEKMEDTKFNGEHPNGYNKGFKLNATIINLELSEQYNYCPIVQQYFGLKSADIFSTNPPYHFLK